MKITSAMAVDTALFQAAVERHRISADEVALEADHVAEGSHVVASSARKLAAGQVASGQPHANAATPVPDLGRTG